MGHVSQNKHCCEDYACAWLFEKKQHRQWVKKSRCPPEKTASPVRIVSIAIVPEQPGNLHGCDLR